MMKSTLLFLSLLLAFGCKKQPGPEASKSFDYFIFGTAHGKCINDCVKLFKLEGKNLNADDNAQYSNLNDSQNIPFLPSGLSADKVALAEALQAKIPAGLFEAADGRLGCPDCYDQGLYFVKIKSGDTVREWQIDRDVAEYTAYCELIQTTMEQLK